MDIGFLCYLASTAAFTFLSVLIVISWHGRKLGALLLVASLVTAVWSAVLAVQALYNIIPVTVIWSLEILRCAIWLAFFLNLLNAALLKGLGQVSLFRKLTLLIYSTCVGLLLLAWGWSFLKPFYPTVFQPNLQHAGQVVLSLIGLILIEQFYRNARPDQRWGIKFICLAVGGMFAYDFYLYSDAMLFKRINTDLWIARGAVFALLVPFIGISTARNPEWSVDLFLSRGVLFHTATLLGAGVYLLLMSVAGYYIKLYGGEWGTVAQIVFLVGAFMVLALLLFSGQLRSQLRVFVSRHFFSYAYDYRQEWLNIISTLSETGSGFPLQKRVILALGELVESPSGVLWIRGRGGYFYERDQFGNPEIHIESIAATDPIIVAMREQEYVINLGEMHRVPEMYSGLDYPEWIAAYANAWVFVPLFHADDLYGVVLLTRPRTHIDWNWEVIELLRTSGRQAAGYLAFEDAAAALSEARQFEGFNRLSAFVIHDLKNLIAQLSLVVRNSERHSENPEFMKDAIHTVRHSVDKMSRLMSQLRNAGKGGASANLRLVGMLDEVVNSRSGQLPRPSLELLTREDVTVAADSDRLASAFEHIIQNAQEACDKAGRVSVRLHTDDNQAIVEVEDNGHGMESEFIRTRLFKPFDTTKGLTGMGIGAYESRDYIQSLGGDLQVSSKVGSGSRFVFRIPVVSNQTEI